MGGPPRETLSAAAGNINSCNLKPPSYSSGEEVVWGEYVQHAHTSRKNRGNAALCALALTPSVVATVVLYTRCDPAAAADYSSLTRASCSVAMEYPIALANILFFVNVTVGFWVIGLVQRSFWLIDPYWTLIPPLLGHLYQLHPRARYNATRSAVSLGLLWLWSARLTHSYFRREDWKFGQREDWRYSKMARDHPRLWPLMSFFAVGLAQQPMLVGITLPAYSAHFSTHAIGPLDVLGVVLGVGGLACAAVADNQLRVFMLNNQRLVAASQPKVALLHSGLWRWSRHPNYFGEQLWWWAFSLFAVGVGQWYMCGGAFINSVVLAVVTVMTEQRMLRGWSATRAAGYRAYIRRTSAVVPLPLFLCCAAELDGAREEVGT